VPGKPASARAASAKSGSTKAARSRPVPGRPRRPEVGPARIGQTKGGRTEGAEDAVRKRGATRQGDKPIGGRPRPGARPQTSASRRPKAATKSVAKRMPRGKAFGVPGVRVSGALGPRGEEVLSPPALAFLVELHRRFEATRRRLIAARARMQKRYDSGVLPDFLPDTREIREGDWKIAPIPKDLLDRRIEITGPVDRKMMINALNCGANVYMADFEDANSPTWENNIDGQVNLIDRWTDRLAFTDPATRKAYSVGPDPAVMIVRPRGWHMLEQHLQVDGEPIAASLFDFGLAFFHNAKAQIAKGTGPYFYLPKLETNLEARLWNEVFIFAQNALGIARGTVKATALIETLPAAFEMHEILWELRDHIVGLNAGRWDYIFSFIKKLRRNPKFVLPDRSQVVMGKAFLHAYALLLIKTCHHRGAFAMGGMAAQIPIKNNHTANQAAFAKVRADKEREANDGHDGTWVAHPDLVPVAKQVFDRLMPQPNQLDRLREDVRITRNMLLGMHHGTKTEAGFRENIRVGVQYIEAWLSGRGAVPIYNLMEDAATAEICRAQIWQWLTYGAVLENGNAVTPDFFDRALKEETERVRAEIGAQAYGRGRFPEAIELFRKLSLAPQFEEFLTTPAYQLIV
jgi:malate synthase